MVVESSWAAPKRVVGANRHRMGCGLGLQSEALSFSPLVVSLSGSSIGSSSVGSSRPVLLGRFLRLIVVQCLLGLVERGFGVLVAGLPCAESRLSKPEPDLEPQTADRDRQHRQGLRRSDRGLEPRRWLAMAPRTRRSAHNELGPLPGRPFARDIAPEGTRYRSTHRS